jgi:hypothetical protein
MLATMLEDVRALLVDLDEVLYVEDQPIPGASKPLVGCASTAWRSGLSPTQPRTHAIEHCTSSPASGSESMTAS